MTEAFAQALVAELARKTRVCWLRYGGPSDDRQRDRAAWHVWHDDALHLVAGGGEQQLPGLADADRVAVLLRSKENGGRLVTWIGRPSVVLPDDDRWQAATDALLAERLNLPDLAAAKAGWEAHSLVLRIDPTGETVESPGRLSDDPHLAPPPPTTATTRRHVPRQVLRRGSRRTPPLT